MVEPTGYTALDLIGFTDKGTYDPAANYVRNDLVHVGNSTWRCKIDDTTGITPTEGANWTIFIESATSLAGMDDVNITTPEDGDLLQYNGANSKWKNSHDVWDTMAQNGAHNLCPFPYYSGGTQIIANLTITVGSKGELTASGTTDGDGNFIFFAGTLKKNIYKVKFKGTFTGDNLVLRVYDSTADIIIGNASGNNEITFQVDATNENHTIALFSNWTGAQSITISGRPLLKLASDPTDDDTPFAMTNVELTEKLYISESSTGTNLSHAITAGDTYEIPNDGIYIFSCYQRGTSGNSATMSIGTTPFIVNDKSDAIYISMPLRKGTLIKTRANGTNDNYGYWVWFSFC